MSSDLHKRKIARVYAVIGTVAECIQDHCVSSGLAKALGEHLRTEDDPTACCSCFGSVAEIMEDDCEDAVWFEQETTRASTRAAEAGDEMDGKKSPTATACCGVVGPIERHKRYAKEPSWKCVDRHPVRWLLARFGNMSWMPPKNTQGGVAWNDHLGHWDWWANRQGSTVASGVAPFRQRGMALVECALEK